MVMYIFMSIPRVSADLNRNGLKKNYGLLGLDVADPITARVDLSLSHFSFNLLRAICSIIKDAVAMNLKG